MENRAEIFKSYLFNGLYFAVILIAAFGIATQALARKVNTYEMTKKPLFFSVEK